MNVELKLSVPLAKLSALAAALIATLGVEGTVAAIGAIVAEPATEPAPAPAEVKPGKGKSKPAANAADTATAGKTDAASAPAPSPTPSTSETQSAAAELPVYEKTDIGPRIIAISESGNAENIAKVKALLGQYQHNGFADKTCGSGRHLRREDINDFNEKFTALEASFKAAAEEAMG